MEIIVKKPPLYDVEAHLLMQPSDAIEKLKKTIEEKMGIPCDEQKLSCYGNVLEDGTLSDNNVKSGYIIFAERLSYAEMQVFVRLPMVARTIVVHIKPNDYVDDLRVMIEKREEIPPEHQRLTFAAKNLENRHKLSYYGIHKDSTVDLSFRLPGGMQTW